MSALNRRSLFALAPAVALVGTPAQAAQPDPWDVFLAGLRIWSPAAAQAAEKARERGYRPDECITVMQAEGKDPIVLFRHVYGDNDWMAQ